MMRNLLAQGAIGELVRQAQTKLVAAGFLSEPCDGLFGKDTATAVTAFQQANSLQTTGAVDDNTWVSLFGPDIPPVSARSLQLTACFENHGFGLAMGNFDGALLTWGIIGFTLSSGNIQKIIANVQALNPQRARDAFGDSSAELLELMAMPKDRQTQWANDHTVKNGQLAEPWRTMFEVYGSYPEVQDAQLQIVRSDYFAPCFATCRALGLTSELGLALAFDIQVQNGGIGRTTRKQILAKCPAGAPESELRKVIANAVADRAAAKWREDVRRRKLTIATGKGSVHGHTYTLDAWGLSEQYAAAEIPAQQTNAGRSA